MRRVSKAAAALVLIVSAREARSEGKKCIASAAGPAPTAADLANLDLRIERLETRVPIAKESADAATAAYEALAQQAGTDPALADKVTSARNLAKAKRVVWEEASEELKCLERSRAAEEIHYELEHGGGHQITVAPSLAGGAGGTTRFGGSILYSVQSSAAHAFEAGIGVDRLWEVATDAERNPAHDRGRGVVVLGLRPRVYFGGLRTSVFLGVHPDVLLRPQAEWNGRPGGAQLSLAAQAGVRVRTLGSVPVSMRFFLEPRAVLDGTTPVSLLFGVELGLGVRIARNHVETARYRFE